MNENIQTFEPKISVVCPVYNAEKCIRETLDSLLSQTFRDFEVLCVDDGSRDSTPSIVKEYAQKDSRVRFFQKPNGKTAARCVSFAIPFCRGKYFFFVSHDDFFDPDLLEKMYRRAIETGAEAVVADVVMYYEGVPAEKLKVLTPLGKNHDLILSGEEAFFLSVDGWKIPGVGLRLLSSYKKSGIYDHWFNSDEFSAWKHFLNSEKVCFADSKYYYRQVPDAVTKKISPLLFETLCTDRETLELIETQIAGGGGTKWATFLRKRMKSLISELRTKRKSERKHKNLFTEEERTRIRSQIESTEKFLLRLILKKRDFPLLFRFWWKLKVT